MWTAQISSRVVQKHSEHLSHLALAAHMVFLILGFFFFFFCKKPQLLSHYSLGILGFTYTGDHQDLLWPVSLGSARAVLLPVWAVNGSLS